MTEYKSIIPEVRRHVQALHDTLHGTSRGIESDTLDLRPGSNYLLVEMKKHRGQLDSSMKKNTAFLHAFDTAVRDSNLQIWQEAFEYGSKRVTSRASWRERAVNLIVGLLPCFAAKFGESDKQTMTMTVSHEDSSLAAKDVQNLCVCAEKLKNHIREFDMYLVILANDLNLLVDAMQTMDDHGGDDVCIDWVLKPRTEAVIRDCNRFSAGGTCV